ncbi:MAG: zinc-ribbon domain-containing protein [Actinobacteria bacterium]|nr:MAG: zinc-ribbon domain-containing protein [Actinomycetota bacterium]
MTVCPTCGEENPARARFCLNCGSALPAEREPSREERKLVTVLFCDLVGFTARSDNADPEDVRATLRPYHARLRTEIERFGGTVEKFIGDAVMAVFGAPVAHEDDAERSVRSALRILGAIGELNEQRPSLELSVRIGINTGEAVVALGARAEEGEGIVTGDVVNTAARLQGVAPVGGVVVGQMTYRATKDLVEYEELEPVTVKGKAEPVPIWRALSARSRFGIDVEQGTRTPFVGRDNEFAVLTQTFARAVGEPSVQLVTITGEPGVGKTRLLWELRRHLDDLPDLIYWRQGRCLPYGEGVTYWALGEMVKAQAGILESDAPEAAGRLAPLIGVGGIESEGGGSRDESFTAWGRFLEAIAARDPLVLVFEDLHWADGPLVEFVEHLVEWSSGVPLFVVCSARPELYERYPGWGGGKRNSTTISLPPLTETDTARLLSALLEQAVLPAEVQAELLDRAGGNPLYAEEFVRMLTDRGILERHGASLRIAANGGGIPMPESVHALIGARLDTLSADRKALLQNASVVGKVFWSGTVAAMGGVGETSVREGLHDLSRKELVRTVRTSSVQDQVEYSFWHALVRDVAYGQIPRAERAAKHLAVAAWIEAAAGERVTDQAEFLAYHYEQAIELTLAAGREPDVELRRKTAGALALAGERAQRLDFAKAVQFYRRAEAALPPGDPELPVLRVRALAAGVDVGETNIPEMRGAFEAAVEHLKARDETIRAGAMLREYSQFLKWAGATGEALQRTDEAVELLEPFGPSRELLGAYCTRAGENMMLGNLEVWEHWTAVTLEMADQLDLPEYRMRALQYRGIAGAIRGDPQGKADLEEAVRLGYELGLGKETAVGYDNLADWVSALEGPAAGLAIYEEGMRFAERRGNGTNRMWMLAETTWRLFDLGRWDEVIAASEDVRRWHEGRGLPQPVMIAGTQEAKVHAFRGELDRAEELMAELLPAARIGLDVQSYRPALTTSAQIAAHRGRPGAAAELLGELVTDLGKGVSSYGMLDGVLVARAIGDQQLAARILGTEGIEQFAVARASLRASRAEVLEGAGDLAGALAAFEDVTAEWDRLGHVFARALALLGGARCLGALGRARDAADRAREAKAVFDSVGARWLSAEAAALAPEASTASS